MHMGEENVAKGKAKNVLKSKELDVRRDEERTEEGRGEEGRGRERTGGEGWGRGRRGKERKEEKRREDVRGEENLICVAVSCYQVCDVVCGVPCCVRNYVLIQCLPLLIPLFIPQVRDADLHNAEEKLHSDAEALRAQREEMQKAYADKLGGLQSEEAALEATRGELVASEAEAGMRMRAGALSKNLLARQVRLAMQGSEGAKTVKDDQAKRFQDAMTDLETTQAAEAASAKERLRRRLERKQNELGDLLEGIVDGEGDGALPPAVDEVFEAQEAMLAEAEAKLSKAKSAKELLARDRTHKAERLAAVDDAMADVRGRLDADAAAARARLQVRREERRRKRTMGGDVGEQLAEMEEDILEADASAAALAITRGALEKQQAIASVASVGGLQHVQEEQERRLEAAEEAQLAAEMDEAMQGYDGGNNDLRSSLLAEQASKREALRRRREARRNKRRQQGEAAVAAGAEGDTDAEAVAEAETTTIELETLVRRRKKEI